MLGVWSATESKLFLTELLSDLSPVVVVEAEESTKGAVEGCSLLVVERPAGAASRAPGRAAYVPLRLASCLPSDSAVVDRSSFGSDMVLVIQQDFVISFCSVNSKEMELLCIYLTSSLSTIVHSCVTAAHGESRASCARVMELMTSFQPS